MPVYKRVSASFSPPFWLNPVVRICKIILRVGLPIPLNTIARVAGWWMRKTMQITLHD